MSNITTPVVITQPTTEPVTLAEVELHCKIDSETERGIVWGIYLPAARRHIEHLTARALMEQTLECTLDGWPADSAIPLPRATPLLSISSIKYKDSDATTTEWSSGEYIADTDSTPGQVVLGYGESWPSFTAYPTAPIRIRYVAGVANTSPVSPIDPTIKLALLLLVAAMYQNREKLIVSEVSAAARDIASLYNLDSFLAQHVATYVF